MPTHPHTYLHPPTHAPASPHLLRCHIVPQVLRVGLQLLPHRRQRGGDDPAGRRRLALERRTRAPVGAGEAEQQPVVGWRQQGRGGRFRWMVAAMRQPEPPRGRLPTPPQFRPRPGPPPTRRPAMLTWGAATQRRWSRRRRWQSWPSAAPPGGHRQARTPCSLRRVRGGHRWGPVARGRAVRCAPLPLELRKQQGGAAGLPSIHPCGFQQHDIADPRPQTPAPV